LLLMLRGCFSYVVRSVHLLNNLLRLELLGLGVYFALAIKFLGAAREFYFSLFFLVMVVCEGVLGLSLLVGLCWGYGQDYMKSLSLGLC